MKDMLTDARDWRHFFSLISPFSTFSEFGRLSASSSLSLRTLPFFDFQFQAFSKKFLDFTILIQTKFYLKSEIF